MVARWGRASGGFALQPGNVALSGSGLPTIGPASPGPSLRRPPRESDFYDVEGWKSGAKVDLYPLLVDEVGDVAGKDLLHLQCHFGLDTLAWARRGARPGSGVWRLPAPDDARLPCCTRSRPPRARLGA